MAGSHVSQHTHQRGKDCFDIVLNTQLDSGSCRCQVQKKEDSSIATPETMFAIGSDPLKIIYHSVVRDQFPKAIHVYIYIYTHIFICTYIYVNVILMVLLLLAAKHIHIRRSFVRKRLALVSILYRRKFVFPSVWFQSVC